MWFKGLKSVNIIFMSKKKAIIICGGGKSEHEISLISAKYIHDQYPSSTVWQIQSLDEVTADSLSEKNGDYIIPCLHGHPGETGDIQPLLEKFGYDYLGCREQASKDCFDKVQTKMKLTELGIPNTPYLFLSDKSELNSKKEALIDFFHKSKKVFVKASQQGSSVGCYPVEKVEDLETFTLKAFAHSPNVLIEKHIIGRELEVATFDYQGKVIATAPGEIHLGEDFYSYEEKYAQSSSATTSIQAKDLSKEQIETIKEYSLKAFKGFNLRHLSRIDFFLAQDGEIYLNEINTFPGMTPISMFPKMMENSGVRFPDWLDDCIN